MFAEHFRLVAAALLSGALFYANASQALAGATLDRVLSTGVVTEVLDRGYPPFSFMNDQNEMDGFDIDVAKEFARRLGVELQVDTPAWEVIAAGRWNGRWDVCICSMTPTKERAEVLDFVAKYYSTPTALLVHRDNHEINGINDLDGKAVGAQSGSSYERYLNKTLSIEGPETVAVNFPAGEPRIVPYDSEITAFQDLALGAGKRLDAVVTSLLAAKGQAEADPRLRVIETNAFYDPLWVATDKGDPEWNERVSSIINEMREDGTLAAISIRRLGVDVTR